MSDKLVLKLDASGLSKSTCQLAYKRVIIDGYSDKIPYNDTLYGNAFHKFVAIMYETGGDFAKATLAAQELFAKPKEIRNGKAHLTEHHLLKTCIDYWQHFQSKDTFNVLVRDGKPMVEVDFSEQYYEDDFVRVLLEGTVDKYGKFTNGMFCIGDYKTHSLWSITKGNTDSYTIAAIKNYFRQFELSSQLRFYTFVTRLLGERYPDSVYGEFARHPFGAFIDGIFISSKLATMFYRSDVFTFTEYDMQSYKRSLDKKISELVWLAKHPEYEDMDGIIQGACNEGRFPCKFQDACLAKQKEVRDIVLKNNFTKKPYNPLEFSK